jgi:hypothetical protein
MSKDAQKEARPIFILTSSNYLNEERTGDSRVLAHEELKIEPDDEKIQICN